MNITRATSNPKQTETESKDLKPSDKRNFIGRYEKPAFISTDEAIKCGYGMPQGNVPSDEECPFCGSKLKYYGLTIPGLNKVFKWMDTPETCICPNGQAAEAERRKKAADAEKQKKLEEQNKAMRERVNRLMHQSGMRARYVTRTFDRFKVDKDNECAYNAVKNYAENFENMLPKRSTKGKYTMPETECNGLFIVGNYGTGKTHLAAAAANELIERGIPVICMTMIDLLARIKSTFDTSGTENEESITRLYETIPLLIIDDIGSEQPTEWGSSRIYAIINARYEACMPTIVTTNYGTAELIKRMTPHGSDSKNAEKTIDRLREMCVGVELYGRSHRSIY